MPAILIAILLFVTLSGCSESNPLLGEWRVETGPDTVAQTIQFTDSQVISNGAADSVTYKIKDDQVIVTSSLGFDVIYTLVDQNTMTVTLPGTGKVVYKRAGG